MRKSMWVGVVAVFFIMLVCGVGIGYASGKGTADGLEFDLKKAAVAGARVVAEGTRSLELQGVNTNNWGYLAFPDSGIKDMEVRGILNIALAGKWYSWSYSSYFPFEFHYTTEQPGYDFGIMLRQENRGVFYRVLFSTKWNEVALWKEGEPGIDPDAPPLPTGFFAVVKEHEIKQGQDYAFAVKVIGNRLQVMLDGKTVLEYEDKILPLEKGGWGFGIFNGASVKVGGLELRKAGGEIKIAAKKRPQFKAKQWRGDNVIFDGDEPIARLLPGGAVWLVDVKFRPGYRAQMSWVNLFDTVDRASKLENFRCAEGDTVKCSFASFGLTNEYITGKGTLTVSYDPKRDTYCYDVDQTVAFKQDSAKYIYKTGGIYFADMFYYNSMPPSDESLKRDWRSLYTASSPCRMALVKGADGTPYRWPIFHSSWLEKRMKLLNLAKDMYFIRYPEPIICPTVELVSLGEDYEPKLVPCGCYWDIHISFIPLKNGKVVTTLKAGDVYREQYRVLGYPRAEADKLFEKSKLVPLLDPDIECAWYVPGVNSFAKGGTVEQTAGGREIWECGKGVTWDKTVGHNDTFSLRFNDNGKMDPLLGYNDDGMESDEWEISAWVKADQWEGAGVRIGIRRLQSPPQKIFEGTDYILPKPGEWQKITYTSKIPTRDNIYIHIETSGKGTCWVDDVEFKKLKLPEKK